jgi:hypothetical protein
MDRSSERIREASPSSLGRGVTVRNNLPFVPELVNFLEHLLRRHLVRIVTNVEQVFFQINSDVLNAWKP